MSIFVLLCVFSFFADPIQQSVVVGHGDGQIDGSIDAWNDSWIAVPETPFKVAFQSDAEYLYVAVQAEQNGSEPLPPSMMLWLHKGKGKKTLLGLGLGMGPLPGDNSGDALVATANPRPRGFLMRDRRKGPLAVSEAETPGFAYAMKPSRGGFVAEWRIPLEFKAEGIDLSLKPGDRVGISMSSRSGPGQRRGREGAQGRRGSRGESSFGGGGGRGGDSFGGPPAGGSYGGGVEGGSGRGPRGNRSGNRAEAPTREPQILLLLQPK